MDGLRSSRPARGWVTLAVSVVALARCGFPEREFDDSKFAQLVAGGAAGGSGEGGTGQGGTSGAGTSGAGASGAPVAGQGGEGGTSGAGVGGEAGNGAGGATAGAGGGSGAGTGQGGAGASGAGAGGGGGSCVDEGKTVTCGQGECERTVPACKDGVTQTCVPGTPAVLEVCGDTLDNNCNGAIDEYCGAACVHDQCVSAGKLKNDCDECVGAICEKPQFTKCCAESWSPDCIDAVSLVCGVALCKSQCVHGLCEKGAPLLKNCDRSSAVGVSCVTKICDEQPSCCSGTWDQDCVDKVNTVCGLGCSL